MGEKISKGVKIENDQTNYTFAFARFLTKFSSHHLWGCNLMAYLTLLRCFYVTDANYIGGVNFFMLYRTEKTY